MSVCSVRSGKPLRQEEAEKFIHRWLLGKTAWFDSPRIIFWAVFLAGLISLPTLTNGIFLDDYGQRIKLLTGDPNIFDQFGYGEALIPSGELSWWTHPETRIRFFRPLAAWLTELDYTLWPDHFWVMHLHTLLWYGVLVAVAGRVYRGLMPGSWAAGLAVVLFAIDAHHAGAVQWLCNRNVLISLLCGLLCLHCHRAAFKGCRLLAAGLFILALSAGESALAMSGYLLAHELFLAKDRWQDRFVRLLPYTLIGVLYLAFWHYSGYGASGPGFYIDPARHPDLFFEAMLFRAPAYLASQFFPPPAELLGLLEAPAVREFTLLPTLVYVLIVVGLLAWFFWPLLRQSASARFFALGMVIALLPLSGITLVSRVLWYVGFGATGLLALYVQAYRQAMPGVQERRYSRIFVASMLVLHLVLSPLLYLFNAKAPDLLDQMWDTQVLNLPNATGTARRVLLLSCNNYITDVTFPLIKDKALSLGQAPTRPPPTLQKIFALAEGQQPYTLSRLDADTLLLRSVIPLKTMRFPPYGFSAGEVVHYEGTVIEIRAVSATGAPTEIRYHFPPGELASYEVMEWKDKKFAPARLPAIGYQMEVRSGA